MPNFICTTCGTQYAESDQPPAACAVCQDDRQYLKVTGQQWTTLDTLRMTHRNSIRFEEAGLTGIGVEPHFAIGQRALLVRTRGGNVLWDCVPLLDPALVEMVQALGGVSAIAISHPHYYTSMVEWSRAFGAVPIHLHAADRQWVMRPDKAIAFWDGDTKPLADGLALVRCGGHFDGGTVLHWPAGRKAASRSSGEHPGPAHESYSSPDINPWLAPWPGQAPGRAGRTVPRPASSPIRCASDLPPRLPLRRRFRRILLHPQLHDPLDQVEGHRLIERELKIALWPCVPCDGLLQGFVIGDRRVHPDVVLPSGEVDQNSVLLEGGHHVADRFLRFGRSVADRRPHFLQDRLNLGGELRDIAVDVLRFLRFCHRVVPSLPW
jgi:hypothetical protein